MLLRMALSMVLTWLQSTVKNPKSIEKERQILTEIRDNINVLLES